MTTPEPDEGVRRTHTPNPTTEEMAEEIEHESPEGRPAHPETGPAGISTLLIVSALLMIAAGVLAAFLWRIEIGVAVGVFGLLLLILNPEVWASMFRARERAKAKHHLEDVERSADRKS